jgi:hypothetical protein
LYHKLLSDASLYDFLHRIDLDIAAATRASGCSCGGRLHLARYPRKPRGGPENLGPEYGRRLSFCCAEEGCRQRTTPPSVRFLGRRVYLGVVVVLMTAMCHGVTPQRATALRALVGVGGRTLERWRQWWREVFIASSFWRSARGRFAPPVDVGALPTSLLERFAGRDLSTKVVAALRFLTPLTTSSSGSGASSRPDV